MLLSALAPAVLRWCFRRCWPGDITVTLASSTSLARLVPALHDGGA
jgi:hypothetical protein